MESLWTFTKEMLPSLISLIITGIILGWVLEQAFPTKNNKTNSSKRMLFKKYFPHFVSVGVFILMMSGAVFYNMRCNNGQWSRSIGKRGACSHNQGVKPRHNNITFDIAYSTSLIAYAIAENYRKNRFKKMAYEKS
jgi:hypothetical protein